METRSPDRRAGWGAEKEIPLAQTAGTFPFSLGTSIPIKESLFVAIAFTHELQIAARNLRNFETNGVELVDPFV